jgi:hypothetical protein
MGTSPNFDSLRGELRFRVPASLYSRAGQISTVYDNLLNRWFEVVYSKEVFDENQPVEEDDVAADIGSHVDAMVKQSFNAMTLLEDGGTRRWEFSKRDGLGNVPYPPDDGSRPEIKRVLLDGLEITGAILPRTLVVGRWESVLKLCVDHDDIASTRRAIHYLSMLRGHRHVLQLKSIVVDGHGLIRGYLMPYFPGGTLEERKHLCARWFLQLAQTTDDFNFKCVQFSLRLRNQL